MKRVFKILACLAVLGVVLIGVAYVVLMRAAPPEVPVLGGTVERGTLHVDGLDRSYLAYVPATLAEHPPLVLAFHGSKGDGQTMRVFTGYELDRLADEHGFVVVYPDGFERHWNDCRASGPYAANTLDVDDPAFVRALIRHYRDAYRAGPVFALGFSNGGHMVYRLALELPEEVTAVAAIGANLPVAENLDCMPAEAPVAVMILNGVDDPINPFEGGTVSIYGFGKRGDVLSAEESARYFSRLAGHRPDACSLYRYPDRDGDAATWVERVTWKTSARPDVRLVRVHGGGHTIPQPRFRFPRLLGATNTDINGPKEVWTFFEQQIQPVVVATGSTSRGADISRNGQKARKGLFISASVAKQSRKEGNMRPRLPRRLRLLAMTAFLLEFVTIAQLASPGSASV